MKNIPDVLEHIVNGTDGTGHPYLDAKGLRLRSGAHKPLAGSILPYFI